MTSPDIMPSSPSDMLPPRRSRQALPEFIAGVLQSEFDEAALEVGSEIVASRIDRIDTSGEGQVNA